MAAQVGKRQRVIDRSHVEVCQVAEMNRTDVTVSQSGAGESVAPPGSSAVSEESKSAAQAARATGLVRTPDRRLMWHGVFLFLIGLVTGTQERRFTNSGWRFLRISGRNEWHLLDRLGRDMGPG